MPISRRYSPEHARRELRIRPGLFPLIPPGVGIKQRCNIFTDTQLRRRLPTPIGRKGCGDVARPHALRYTRRWPLRGRLHPDHVDTEGNVGRAAGLVLRAPTSAPC